eukprot:281633_1
MLELYAKDVIDDKLKSMIKEKISKCKDLTKAKACIQQDAYCIWIHELDKEYRMAPLKLEGKGIKKVELIQSSIQPKSKQQEELEQLYNQLNKLTKNPPGSKTSNLDKKKFELEKNLLPIKIKEKQAEIMMERGKITDKEQAAAKAQTDDKEKKNVKFRTIDRDNVMYEMQFESYDEYEKDIHHRLKMVNDWINKLNHSHRKQQVTKVKHKQVDHKLLISKSYKRYQAPVVAVAAAAVPHRRLVSSAVDHTGIGTYQSVGVVATTGPTSDRADYVATGTIIHVGPQVPDTIKTMLGRWGYGGYTNYKYIYVLAAAHDLVKKNGRNIVAPVSHYSFHPHIGGNDAQRIAWMNANPWRNVNNWAPIDQQTKVGPLVRAWIVDTYSSDDDSIDGYGLDVAVMQFMVHHSFNVPAIGFNIDAGIPTVPAALPRNREMISYFLLYGAQDMRRQYVNIYCNGDLCQYDGAEILTGYCGGPVMHGGGITAMQAGQTSTVGFVPNDPHRCGSYLNDQNTDWTHCRGLAAKITPMRRRAIELIVQNQLVNTYVRGIELFDLLRINAEDWRQVQFNWFFDAMDTEYADHYAAYNQLNNYLTEPTEYKSFNYFDQYRNNGWNALEISVLTVFLLIICAFLYCIGWVISAATSG